MVSQISVFFVHLWVILEINVNLRRKYGVGGTPSEPFHTVVPHSMAGSERKILIV